ncbi:MAG: Uma2 family endonuclease [Acidobacteriota bacterium]|nr:Uma2 family endonuclease [Acidobacteriota bacterium]
MSQYGVQLKSTEDVFYELCKQNPNLRLERTAEGEVIVMPPTGGETGNRNHSINGQFYNWTKKDGSGSAFDSSTGFKLPDGADRSPDASWVEKARLAQLSLEEKKKFLPLCPDFAIELRSPSDTLETTKAKMEEYIACGLRLGWLIDPEEKVVYVYRLGEPVQKLENANEVSADPELPGFVLDLREVWEPQL